jgi:hypothetical protein
MLHYLSSNKLPVSTRAYYFFLSNHRNDCRFGYQFHFILLLACVELPILTHDLLENNTSSTGSSVDDVHTSRLPLNQRLGFQRDRKLSHRMRNVYHSPYIVPCC